MMRFGRLSLVILAVASAAFLLVGQFPLSSILFRRYVASPIPSSVSHVRFESQSLILEPVVCFRFSISSEDFVGIVTREGYGKATDVGVFLNGVGSGPAWWNPYPVIERGELFRSKAGEGRGYLYYNRSLSIAYYLYWGI